MQFGKKNTTTRFISNEKKEATRYYVSTRNRTKPLAVPEFLVLWHFQKILQLQLDQQSLQLLKVLLQGKGIVSLQLVEGRPNKGRILQPVGGKFVVFFLKVCSTG